MKKVKLYKFVLVAFLFCFVLKLNAQEKAMVKFIQDNRVERLIAKHKKYNDEMPGQGFRVQIFFDSGSNSRDRAYRKKSGFLNRYAGIKAYVVFETPYYKVRVGDFMTHLDAEGFKNKIINEYPEAYIVEDEIILKKD